MGEPYSLDLSQACSVVAAIEAEFPQSGSQAADFAFGWMKQVDETGSFAFFGPLTIDAAFDVERRWTRRLLHHQPRPHTKVLTEVRSLVAKVDRSNCRMNAYRAELVLLGPVQCKVACVCTLALPAFKGHGTTSDFAGNSAFKASDVAATGTCGRRPMR